MKGETGTFENEKRVSEKQWLLVKRWSYLNDKTLLALKRKVPRSVKENWPQNILSDGLQKWL